MATKNPKISVYVSDKLKEKLLEAKNLRRTHSLTSVVVEILEEYFNLSQPSANEFSNAWVEQTNARLEALENQIQELLRRPESSKTSNIPKEEPLSIRTEEPKQCSLLEGQSNAEEEQILSSSKVTELTNLSRKQLEGIRNKDKFPIQSAGWEITGFAGKQLVNGVIKNHWKVRRAKT